MRRKPIHEMFAMLVDRPFIPALKKCRMLGLKMFQCLDRRTRKMRRNTIVIGLHKNQKRRSVLILFELNIFRAYHAHIVTQINDKSTLMRGDERELVFAGQSLDVRLSLLRRAPIPAFFRIEDFLRAARARIRPALPI